MNNKTLYSFFLAGTVGYSLADLSRKYNIYHENFTYMIGGSAITLTGLALVNYLKKID